MPILNSEKPKTGAGPSMKETIKKIRGLIQEQTQKITKQFIQNNGTKPGQKNRLDFFEKKYSLAIAGFFVFWFIGALVFQQAIESLLAGMIGGTAGFFWKRQYPIWKQKQKIRRIEAELPFILLGMSIEFNVHRPFEKILERASESEWKEAGKEFQKVNQEIQGKGASVQEALLHFSERLSSTEAKRAVIQLIHAYEQGTKKNRGKNVKAIANELLAKQRIEAKAFGSKLALFSLIFIAVAAIVPALFQSLVLVGSAFLSFEITPPQVLLLVAVGFPLLDLAVLAFIRHKTPVFLR